MLQKRNFVMACNKCGSKTWSDDDLHWQWCENPNCFYSFFANNERTTEYDAEIAYREQVKIERGEE